MPLLPGRRTLFRDLILALSLISFVAVSLLGTILFVVATQREEEKIVEQADRLSDEVAQAIALPLLNLEGDTVGQISEAYLSSDFIEGLSLRIENLTFWEKMPTATQGMIERHRVVMTNGIKAGDLTLVFRRDSVRVIQRAVVLIMTATITCLVIVVIPAMYLLIRQLVNKPLVLLGEGLRNIASGNDGEPLAPMAQDDINDIVMEVNQMAAKIRDRNRQILDSESRFRDLFENARDGIFQMSPEGRLIRVNPAMAALLAYDSGDELLIHSSSSGIGGLNEVVRAVTDPNGLGGDEVRITRKDGASIWVRIKARPVFDAKGGLCYLEGFMEDVTQAREMKDVLIRAKEDLASQVEDRTRTLVEKSEKMERMNRLFIHRELTMKKLKQENRALKDRLNGKETS
jgi:PAS domain S-box-containing protein